MNVSSGLFLDLTPVTGKIAWASNPCEETVPLFLRATWFMLLFIAAFVLFGRSSLLCVWSLELRVGGSGTG